MRARRLRWTAALGLALSMMLSWPAHAEPTAQQKSTARSLFLEGDKEYRAGHYQAALKAFQAADDIMGLPTTGLELARTLMKLGMLVEAHDKLLEVSRMPVKTGERRAQTVARAEAKSLAKNVARRVPSLKVVIVGAPDGAHISLKVDDVAVPQTAVEFPQKVNPGERVVDVQIPGFRPESRTVTVRERQRAEIKIELSRVVEDGEALDPWSEDQPEDETSAGLPVLSWIGFSVAVVGVGVGTVTGIMAVSKKNDLDVDCPAANCPPAVEDQLDKALVIAHVSTIAFVVGGAGIATGITGWLLREQLDSSASGVKPYVGFGTAGLSGHW